jgi:hypothetical protein
MLRALVNIKWDDLFPNGEVYAQIELIEIWWQPAE